MKSYSDDLPNIDKKMTERNLEVAESTYYKLEQIDNDIKNIQRINRLNVILTSLNIVALIGVAVVCFTLLW